MALKRGSQDFKLMKLRMSGHSFTKGQSTDMLQTPMRYTTNKASAALNKLGYMKEPRDGVSTDQMAYEMMHAIGYTVKVGNPDYSLVNSQTDDELVENPNISNEQQMASLENENVEMTDQFPNECDPIYQPDDSRPESLRENAAFRDLDEVRAIDLVGTGFAFGNLGLLKTKPNQTSRYFNNQDIGSALKTLNR